MFSLCMCGFSPGTPTSAHLFENMHGRLTGYSELALEVSVHVGLSHLSLCGPLIEWQPVQGVPCISPRSR